MDTMPLDCWLSAKNNINVEALQFQFLSILFMIERINIKEINQANRRDEWIRDSF